jgi:hypothetical protein
VGQTPWSARDALVPLSAHRIKSLHMAMADEGVGRGRGRPPYNENGGREPGRRRRTLVR